MKAIGGAVALVALALGLYQMGCEVQPDEAGQAELRSRGPAVEPAPQAPAPVHAIRPEGMAVVPVYSPVIRAGGFLFLSGSVGNLPGGGLVEGGVEAETRQALANVAALLDAAGAQVSDLVRCTVYLADVGDYEAMNAIYGEFVADPPPARTTVGVAGLPLGARVEVECTARDPGGP